MDSRISLLDSEILRSFPKDHIRINPAVTTPCTATAIPNALRTPIMAIKPFRARVTKGSSHRA
jgi:hypothetical protein